MRRSLSNPRIHPHPPTPTHTHPHTHPHTPTPQLASSIGGRRLFHHLAVFYLMCLGTITYLETHHMLPPSNVSEEEAVSVRCTYNVLVLIAYYLGCLWNEKNHKENEALLRAMADRATQASRCVFCVPFLPFRYFSLLLSHSVCVSVCLCLPLPFSLSLALALHMSLSICVSRPRFPPPSLLLSLSLCACVSFVTV